MREIEEDRSAVLGDTGFGNLGRRPGFQLVNMIHILN